MKSILALRKYRLGIVVMLAGILVTVIFFMPQDLEFEVLAPRSEKAKIGLSSNRVVGQSFMPTPGLRGIAIPLKVVTDSTVPILLHIRNDFFGEDLRVSSQFISSGEQVVFFPFNELEAEGNLLWILETPHTLSPAVFVYREVADEIFAGGEAYINGKNIPGNFGFSLIGSQPKGVVAVQTLGAKLIQAKSSAEPWEKQAFLFGLVMMAIALASGSSKITLFHKQRFLIYCLIVIIAMSFLAHTFLARNLPLVNDEGAYLQDAWQTQFNLLPIRDYATKGPVYIILLKLWQTLVPNSVYALRLFSTVMWSLATVFLFILTRQLSFSPSQRVLAVLFFALSPAAVALSTPLLLQTASIAVSLAALVVVIRGVKEEVYWLVVSGALLMVVAYFTRASSIVVALMGLVLIYIFGRYPKKYLMLYVGTGIGAALLIALVALIGMGGEKTLVLFNAETFHIAQQRQILVDDGTQESFVRQLVIYSSVLLRGAPWLVATLFVLPVAFLDKRLWLRLFTLIFWFGAMLAFARQAFDMELLLPGELPLARGAIVLLVFSVPVVIGVYMIYRPARSSFPVIHRRILITLVIWIVLLVSLYHNWGRWQHSYLVEFLPPLALMAGMITTVVRATVPKYVFASLIFLVGFSGWTGWQLVYRYPHTGTLDQRSVRAMALEIEKHVPKDETIFTAQPVVTALAQRPIFFAYTHPGWYRDEYLGKLSPSLRSLYFADPDDITEYLSTKASFVLADRRTYDVYFEFYPERQLMLQEKFELLAEVDNPLTEEPLQLFTRISP